MNVVILDRMHIICALICNEYKHSGLMNREDILIIRLLKFYMGWTRKEDGMSNTVTGKDLKIG